MTSDKNILIRNIYYMLTYAFKELRHNNYEYIAGESFDNICDLFAEADMYGLGKGVYPKDKAPPIPLHPYCMCRLEEVFKWEVDISKQKNNVKQAGDTWLSGISDENRRLVLGIEGNAIWKEGENWQKYMRNWKGLAEPETRIGEKLTKEFR